MVCSIYCTTWTTFLQLDQQIHRSVQRTCSLCSPCAGISMPPSRCLRWRALSLHWYSSAFTLTVRQWKTSISDERKCALLDELSWMRCRDKCTKWELLSLIGKLSFCCKVVPSGRIFLRRMIDLSNTVTQLHYHITLTTEARLDIQWWLEFLPSCSGTSLILNTRWTPSPALKLYTDASGAHGWGAYGSGRWIQSHWSPSQNNMDITWKELFAAVHTWGPSWSRQKILFHCDNQAVVEIWERGSTRVPHTMGLVRLLYFCASHYNINVCVTHIPGVCNNIADSLSRF